VDIRKWFPALSAGNRGVLTNQNLQLEAKIKSSSTGQGIILQFWAWEKACNEIFADCAQ
jgi:hypothetical protein|tara:strand:- start:695 stop:871 length:177 start_codon:yes stop_codon:yes gene_type:complete